MALRGMLLDRFIVFLQLVEPFNKSFSVIHGHFMLFHQRFVFFMKDMVVHLQICELSGALAEPPFKCGRSQSVIVVASVRFEVSVWELASVVLSSAEVSLSPESVSRGSLCGDRACQALNVRRNANFARAP